MSGSGEDFQVVTRKKWIARKCLRRRDRHKSESDYLNDCPDVNVDKFQTRLERLCTVMSQSDYFILAMETIQQQLDALQCSLERLVCLGLGPFTRTYQALHQAAFVMSLQKHYQIKEALYYDPVFRDSEKELIQRLDGRLMDEDCKGKDEARLPTLYYMPHCPYALMHNLLWCNWQRWMLPKVLLISNSFEMLTLSRRSKDDHINRIVKHCREISLEDDYEQPNVFNDLSLHTFALDQLPEEDEVEFWKPGEPLKVMEDELANDIEKDLNKLSLEK